MGVKTRIIISVIAVWLALVVVFISSGWDAFFCQLGVEPILLEDITTEQVRKGRAVQGDCYLVYDLIGYGYTEETNKYTGNTTTTTDNYYWLVDCGNDVMLVKTRANDDLSDRMQMLVDSYWDSETWEDYAASFSGAASLDGVFIGNDREIVGFYNEWMSYMEEEDSWKKVNLAPCTLDCTKTYARRLGEFWLGTIMLIVGIIGGIAAAVIFAKTSKKSTALQDSVGMNYGNISGGSYDTYNSTANAGTFHTAYGTGGSTFQPQSGSASYGTNGSTFQSQSGSAGYGTSSSTFQSQSGSAGYGTNGSTFQSQSGSAGYGTSGSTFQSQSGSAGYGTSGSTFQPQSGSAGYGTSGSTFRSQSGSATYGTSGSTFRSQSGSVNYGSSFGGYQSQSGINYGSTTGYGTSSYRSADPDTKEQ